MFGTKLFAAFTIVSFGIVAANPIAAPVPEIAKRDNADIQNVFTTLKSSTDTILPQLTELATSGTANNDNVTPLVNELTTALDKASSDLSTLQPSSQRKRQSDDEIATLVAGIVTDIGNTFSALNTQLINIPALPGLTIGVDQSLNQVLKGLGTLLAGVLNLLANLLSNVATLLRQLAFGLTIGTIFGGL